MNEEEDDDDDSNYNDMEDFQADAKGAYSSPFEEVCEILQFKNNLESKKIF